MKQRRSTAILWSLFLVLGLVNVWIYLHRDRFQYTAYANDAFLYSPQSPVFTDPASIFSATELAKAKAITSGIVNAGMTTPQKVAAISNFLLSRFYDQRGFPYPASLQQASAIEAYEALLSAKEARLWCGHFSGMMLLFAAANGIRGRVIEVYRPGDHHVFNEFFIPEWQQWVMTDIYNDLVFARDTGGRYLDAQSFRRAVNSAAPVRVQQHDGHRLIDTLLRKQTRAIEAYHTAAHPYYYYTTTNLAGVYTPGGKLKRYLGADPWYYIYREEGGTNPRHYAKLGFLAGWLLVTLLLAGTYIKRLT